MTIFLYNRIVIYKDSVVVLKQIKTLKKKFKKYFLLLSVLVLCLVIIVLKSYINKSVEIQRQVSNVEELINSHIVPAGTPLVVPPWIQQQYLQQIAIDQMINNNNTLIDFLIHNYSVAATSNTDEDTFYVPLLRSSYLDKDKKNGYSSLTEYFDVTNVSLEENADLNEPVFRTIDRADTQKNREQIPEPALRTEPIPAEITPLKESQEEPIEDTLSEELPEESNLEDTPPEEPTVETQKPDTISLSPRTKKEKSYESRECNNSSQEDETTEAVASCTECHNNREKIMEGLQEVVHTVEEQEKQKRGFTTVLKNFCDTCQPVDIKDFIQYVNTRSREKNIPPEIFLSLMMQESNGKCNASNTTSGDKSFGLLQLNTKSVGSTCLQRCSGSLSHSSSAQSQRSACQNGNYRTRSNCNQRKNGVCINCHSNNKPLVCLNNPYCNFEESLHLMEEKWEIGNDEYTRKPRERNWLNMNPNERNLWRNAIISYNGAGYMKAAERQMNRSEISTTDNWEKKRVYFIKQNWLAQNTSKQNRVIHNLAYMERVTGREIPCGGEHSIIVEWLTFLEENPSPDCSQF